MAPSQFFVQMQRGITGGFAPPTPSAVHTLTASPETPTTIFIQSNIRPDGTPELTAEAPKEVSKSKADPLIEELHGILKQIPTESPPGSEDIYGMDTSIAFGSDDLEWRNGGLQGCGGGYSEVKATDEDKAKFKRAVEIVQKLVDQ